MDEFNGMNDAIIRAYMWSAKRIEINRKVWLCTSLAMFVLLSLVDPVGTANTNSLLRSIISLTSPSHWVGTEPGSVVITVLFEFLYIALFFVAVAFLSGMSGWLLHFLVVPFIGKRVSAESSMRPIPETSAGQVIHKRTRVLFALGGAPAAVFAGVLTGLHGLQFWAGWFCYDQFSNAITGFHSWSTFQSFILLLIVCGLNAIGSAIITKHMTSDSRGVRLKAIVALGIQFASLVISAENLGLNVHY